MEKNRKISIIIEDLDHEIQLKGVIDQTKIDELRGYNIEPIEMMVQKINQELDELINKKKG